MSDYLFVWEGVNEVERFTGTLEDAIKEATSDRRHLDYGRKGVSIYQVSQPVYTQVPAIRTWMPPEDGQERMDYLERFLNS